MKKLSVKALVDFRRKSSDRSRKTFVEKIKSTKIEPPSESGGDYWTIGLSAVCKAYHQDDFSIIEDKITEVQDKLRSSDAGTTRSQYQRNIAILQKYQGLDSKKLRPIGKLTSLIKSSATWLLAIKGLEVEVDTKRCQVFTFGKKDEEAVGAIWFIATTDGYSIEEVGIFCEMLYRFLKLNYSKNYEVSSEFCIAVDMISGRVVRYADLEDGSFTKALTPTLDEINKLL